MTATETPEPGPAPPPAETPGPATGTVAPEAGRRAPGAGWEAPRGLKWVLRDTWTEAKRNLRVVPRSPDLMIFALVQPVLFVLLFVYVFGGSIDIPGFATYQQYLLPGIFAQTLLFGSGFTGAGVAEDMQKGLIERLRSLPMSQSAVLIGRTVSDLVRNTVTFAVMLLVGFLVGFRFEGSLLAAVAACVLLLGFSYAFSWIMALIGLSVSSVETVNSAGFVWMFPVTFVSSAFVDPSTFPAALRWFADVNPFTAATNASRALYNGYDPGGDLPLAIGWAIAISVAFGYLSSRRFARANRA